MRAAGARKSVQRNNVWYDAKDGRCVRAAPVCDRVAMALPQAVGGHEAAVTATTASIGGWQRSTASCTQMIKKHLGGGIRKKPRRV